MTVPITVNPFDPYGGTTNPGRMLAGPIRTGSVTYDAFYSSTSDEFARWIYVGTTGTLAYMKWDGTIETLPNMAAGVWHPTPSIKILSSGTTIAANQLRWGS